MRNGFIATYENAGIYILNLRPKSHNSADYNFFLSFNIVTKLFGVWVVNYEVMALQKWDKCIRGYFLHSNVLQICYVGT